MCVPVYVRIYMHIKCVVQLHVCASQYASIAAWYAEANGVEQLRFRRFGVNVTLNASAESANH